MSLMRFDPFSSLTRAHSEIDRLFEDFFGGRTSVARMPEMGMRAPAVDISETNGSVVVKAELPGVQKDDLDIEVTEDMLSIKAETKEEKEEKDAHYLRRERSWGMFQRIIPLPVEVKAKEAKASFKDGLLEVTIPKVEAEKKEEKVKIKPE